MPRSVAFSGAMKKKQLKERRAKHSEKLEEQQQMERARGKKKNIRVRENGNTQA